MLNIRSVDYTGRQLPMVQLPGLDFIEQTCWHEFLNSSIQLFAALDVRFKEMHGITLADIRLLDLLATSDRGLYRKSELSRALMLTPNRVAQLIRHLKPQRLVTQSITPYDRRGVFVSITVAGRARLEAARETFAEEVRTHWLDRMSRQQMMALTDIHRRITTQLQIDTESATLEDLI